MIVLIGVSSEPPLAMAADALAGEGHEFEIIDQRDSCHQQLAYRIGPDGVTGVFRAGDNERRVEEITAVYARFADHRMLPEREGLDDGHPTARHIDQLHDRWIRLLDVLAARVVNPLASMASNSSKPYQAQLINDHGLATPTTLVTTDPAAARGFVERHETVVYKSVSGIRSIVRRVDAEALDRLDAVRTCPTQFQAFVPGNDVRVHVVGDAVHATMVRSDADDYRYARLERTTADLEPYELPDELARNCRRLTRALGLWFSGIDLRIADRSVTCFEVNPSPAFSYYEAHTGQPISADLAALLAAA